MKNLATKILIALLLNAFAVVSFVTAEDAIIPIISRPDVLSEGVQRDLTPAQVAELLPWAHSSKIELNELLETVNN